MAIGGTRLDRPSAVGDEGRPRGTSLTVVAAVVVAVLAAAGFLVGQPLVFTSFGLLMGLLSAGLVLLSRDRLWPVVLGHILFLPSAVVLSAIAAVSGLVGLTNPALALLVVGGLVAMFGVTAGWNDVFDTPTLKTALLYSGLSYLAWVALLVVLVVLGVIVWAGRFVVVTLAEGTSPGAALLGLLGLVGLASACLYVAVRSLPAIQLTPVQRRPAARVRYERLQSLLGYLTAGAWGLLVVLVLAMVTGLPQAVLSVPPIATVVVWLTRLAAIPLACVAALSLLLALLSWTARRATAGFDTLSTESVAVVLAAGCYMFILLLAIPALLRFGLVGVAFFFSIPVLPILIYATLFVVLVGFYLGAVPERAGSSALAAAGLVSMGLGGGLYGAPSLFVFGAVAGGLVVWDVGTFGLSVTAELGHIPATRRLELYHGVVAVGVGLLGIAALAGLDIARRSVGSAVGTPTTMGIAVLGVVLVALALRG